MKNTILFFILVALVCPAWAGPSFADLDSWQLPDEPTPVAEPAPAAKVAPKPKKTSKPSTQNKRPVASPVAGDEIVIQLGDGAAARTSSDPSEIAILRKSAAQLAKQLTGRGRFYIVFNADTPAAVDTYINSADGKRYAFVRFGSEEGPYRKFLFQARGNQTLLGVADNLKTTLDLYTRYGADMGITPQEVARTYPKIEPVTLTNENNSEKYQVYPLAGSQFLLFKDDVLQRLFTDQAAYDEFLKTLKKPVLPKTRKPTKARPTRPAPPPPVRKALIEGGTLHDQMYMPRVVNPSAYDNDSLPPLTPSGPPAGTPLIRDVDGKYMNR